jgi:hypothetical protein
MVFRKFASVFVFLLTCVLAGAQGGPPLITDDPIPVELGKWEINTAWVARRLPGRSENEIPLLDVTYGILPRLHIKYEVPWMEASEAGVTSTGIGDGNFGAKWQFEEGKKGGPKLSIFPQVGMSLSKRSIRLGLSEPGTSLLLPMEAQWERGELAVNAEAGVLFQAGEHPGWVGGLAFGFHPKGANEYLAELHGEGSMSSGEMNWLGQLGLRHDFCERATLLFAFGRTLVEHNADRLSWTSYLGLQLRY